MVKLYTTGCSKCRLLESKLKQKEIEYETITDIVIMEELGIASVPVLEVDDELKDFVDAWTWVNFSK